jgi:DNA-binding NarL/FixJ family response regulator
MILNDGQGSVPAAQIDLPANRIIIVTSQRILREAVRAILEGNAALEVVGDAGSASEALTLIDSLKPDVVLTDVTPTDRSGVQFISELHSRWPDVGILALAELGSSVGDEAARKAGALGYVLKSCGSAELLQAIGQVASGQQYVYKSLQLRRRQARIGEPSRRSKTSAVKLTVRQLEVLRSVALGFDNREIAQMLGISAKAVSKHRTRLRNTLDLRGTAGLTLYALRQGLVQTAPMPLETGVAG